MKEPKSSETIKKEKRISDISKAILESESDTFTSILTGIKRASAEDIDIGGSARTRSYSFPEVGPTEVRVDPETIDTEAVARFKEHLSDLASTFTPYYMDEHGVIYTDDTLSTPIYDTRTSDSTTATLTSGGVSEDESSGYISELAGHAVSGYPYTVTATDTDTATSTRSASELFNRAARDVKLETAFAKWFPNLEYNTDNVLQLPKLVVKDVVSLIIADIEARWWDWIKDSTTTKESSSIFLGSATELEVMAIQLSKNFKIPSKMILQKLEEKDSTKDEAVEIHTKFIKQLKNWGFKEIDE